VAQASNLEGETDAQPGDETKQEEVPTTDPNVSNDDQQANPMWNGANPQMFGNGFGLGNQSGGFPGMNWPNTGFGMMPNAMGQNGWNNFPNMMGESPRLSGLKNSADMYP
jgi:hypothetical protein